MMSQQWTKADPEWCRIETVVHGMIIDEAIQKLIANGGSADVDRVIQQALLIVLTLVLDPQFSESSYGFMEGRGAHMALLKSQEYVKQGYQWVVESDLSKFFDRVNHDILMSLVAKVLEDKIIQKLIRLYLKAGIMEEG